MLDQQKSAVVQARRHNSPLRRLSARFSTCSMSSSPSSLGMTPAYKDAQTSTIFFNISVQLSSIITNNFCKNEIAIYCLNSPLNLFLCRSSVRRALSLPASLGMVPAQGVAKRAKHCTNRCLRLPRSGASSFERQTGSENNIRRTHTYMIACMNTSI